MTTKVTIELTKKQAGVVMEALEQYSRISMGQFETIADHFHMDTYDKSLNRPEFDRDMARAYLNQAANRQFLFQKVHELQGRY